MYVKYGNLRLVVISMMSCVKNLRVAIGHDMALAANHDQTGDAHGRTVITCQGVPNQIDRWSTCSDAGKNMDSLTSFHV